MIEIDPNLPGMAEAEAKLAEMEAEAAAAAKADAPKDESVNEGQHAAQVEQTDTQPPASSPVKSDTPAAPAPKAEPAKQQQQDQKEVEPTRYAKAKERQERSWAELNRQKEELRLERERIERERKELEQARAKPEQPAERYTAEEYEQAADTWEKEGKFDLADAAKAKAAQLRKNPTPQQAAKVDDTSRQMQQQQEAQRKEFWFKAVEQWPAVGVKDSPENKRLHEILASEPDIAQHPKGLFYAARLVASETAAARVPEMTKELDGLRAKVKELEALTSPSGERGIPIRHSGDIPFAEKSDAEQLRELEQMAESIGPLR